MTTTKHDEIFRPFKFNILNHLVNFNAFRATVIRNADGPWDGLGVFDSEAVAVLVYGEGWTIEENVDSYYLVLHSEDYLADKTIEGLARLEAILYEFMLLETEE